MLIGCVVLSLGVFGFVSEQGKEQEKEKDDAVSFEQEFEERQASSTVTDEVSKGIKIPGYTVIVIEKNTKEVKVNLENPIENNVYFKISFILDQGNETIFESKLIEPGQNLYHILLSRPLEKGEYKLKVQYDTYSIDGNFIPRNSASVNCSLQVT